MQSILICKPGCLYCPNPKKTNLQIRELEAFAKACDDAGVDATLTTIPWILDNALDLAGRKFVIFNSASVFDDELLKLFKCLCVLDDIDITLVSNDCRLNFNLPEFDASFATDRLIAGHKSGQLKLRIITNASQNLEDYAPIVCNWWIPEIPIYHSALFTLPTFMLGARHTEKTVDTVFACMHFKDYSEQRKTQLTALKDYYGDRMVLTGDMSGMISNGKEVPSVVTDTAKVWQWYENAKTTPVLLEPNYDRFGVMPNRVAEAIACQCIPVLITSSIDNYRNMDGLSLPVSYVDSEGKIMPEAAEVLDRYIQYYDEQAVQGLIIQLAKQLGFYRTQFCVQLRTFFGEFEG